ncbi:complement c1r subcomponent [Plakobranchus ocellatus]|uniref:Complement c1r subcomponent n=1 Tax=Plakobranchus ocellatus TaxID=259542 RepID=A0AAV3Z2A9_9GAST|nr:complement c1r subcomponent [Plakobranchus ocellatus]
MSAPHTGHALTRKDQWLRIRQEQQHTNGNNSNRLSNTRTSNIRTSSIRIRNISSDSLLLVDILKDTSQELCDVHNRTSWWSNGNNIAVLMTVGDLSTGYKLSYKLTNPSGQLTSPVVSMPFPDGSVCETLISAPVGYMVQISFDLFDLEESEDCDKEALLIEDVGWPSRERLDTSRLCGKRTDLMWASQTNIVRLMFKSSFYRPAGRALSASL